MTLVIKSGKYYRTRDGRKVGPMNGSSFFWVAGEASNEDKEWKQGGKHNPAFGGATDADDLVSEWNSKKGLEFKSLSKLLAEGISVGDTLVYKNGWGYAVLESSYYEVTHVGMNRVRLFSNLDKRDYGWYSELSASFALIKAPKKTKVIEGEDMNIDNMTKAQLESLQVKIQNKLDCEEVVLYSVSGLNWGKKRYSESKLKMSYKINKKTRKTSVIKVEEL